MILITGANGFVGKSLVHYLASQKIASHIVAAVRRDELTWPEGIKPFLIGDLHPSTDWKNALQGKTFLDFDSHHRVEIKDVYYSYADRMFVVDYVSNGVESVAPLQDVLQQSTHEPWFLPEYLS